MPAPTKLKGDIAELKVAADLRERGYPIAFPFGEDLSYDLIIERSGKLERVQVKYARSSEGVLCAETRSHSLTNGKVRATKLYTAAMIEWLAIYDATTGRCYYIPAVELGEGMTGISLRLSPPRNGQRRRIRWADTYLSLDDQRAVTGA